MLDILIQNGVVIDGTGKQAFTADVGITAGRIGLVAEGIEQEAERTIEAQGLHLAPGFIDITLLVNPPSHIKIHQGVTTEVIGNCGSSPAPLLGAAVEEVRDEAKSLGLEVSVAGRSQPGSDDAELHTGEKPLILQMRPVKRVTPGLKP
jgi:N-acyl-D-amino-acid deacylase